MDGLANTELGGRGLATVKRAGRAAWALAAVVGRPATARSGEARNGSRLGHRDAREPSRRNRQALTPAGLWDLEDAPLQHDRVVLIDHHRNFPSIARKITSWIFIIRSTAASE